MGVRLEIQLFGEKCLEKKRIKEFTSAKRWNGKIPILKYDEIKRCSKIKLRNMNFSGLCVYDRPKYF